MAKSGHMNSRRNNEGEPNDHAWKRIWELNAPPKLRHFLWRGCKGTLAVKERLFQRHIVVDTICPICNAEIESIVHSLFECKAAQIIWQQSVFAAIVQEAPPLDFMDRWQWMANKLTANELQAAASLMWASWACRNKILFEQEIPDFNLMASGFVRLSHEYCSYANKVFMPYVKRNINSPRVWEGPPTGCVKINTDAHVIQNVACGLGAVFRDDRGELLVTAAKRTEAYSAEIAEAMAVRYGIQIAQKMGFQNIVVESDAWNVVNNIGVYKSGITPIFLIFEDIKKSKSAFNSFSIGHVRRTGNKVAHLVARWELQIRSEHICMGSFPHSVKALADLDYL